ncbi:MAG: restriction endonuclease subunit S [Thiotrichales bacterium]|nr:restriction endonuclease subunit S [Thiotrichales bacterium]MCY4286176.1 restriction endonuclease subunit S [Thiotrichales bacterium]
MTVEIGDYVDVVSGPAYQSASFTDDPSDMPLIKGENIAQGYIAWEKSRYWPIGQVEGYERFRLIAGDIVLAMDRPWITAGLKWARLKPHDPPSLLVQRVARLRARSGLRQDFLAYIIGSATFSKYVRNIMGGTNVPHISGSQIRRFKFPLPRQKEQAAIASTLSAYDDLIENNRRRIALLEEAARLLYREWFVHFRFPGHEHVKILAGIPGGWKRRTLVELAEIVMGQSPKSQFYNEIGEGLPFHQGVSDYGFRFVSHRVFSSAVTKIAEAGDILISVRAPVGRINITRDRIVLGRGLAAIRSRTGHQSFLLYAMKNHFYAEDIIGTGAIYAATNKKELEDQIFLEPSAALLQEFEDQASAIDLQITCLTGQNDNLARARDLLLPRLMNGEVAV